MNERHEEIDARLARLRRATAAVGPRADFATRVATRIERETAPSDWLADLVQTRTQARSHRGDGGCRGPRMGSAERTHLA